jgi:hypothetical protein
MRLCGYVSAVTRSKYCGIYRAAFRTGVRIRIRSIFDTACRVDLIGLRSIRWMEVEFTSTGVRWLNITGVFRCAFHLSCSFGVISMGGFAGPQQ